MERFDQTGETPSRYIDRYLERERKEGRKEGRTEGPTGRIAICYRVQRLTRDNFQIVAKSRGFRRIEDAMEEAMRDWIERNRPPGIQIINMAPISVTVTKIGKLEARLAIQDLQSALTLLKDTPCEAEGYPDFARKLLEQLRKATPIAERTRDPELAALIQQVEAQIP
jgi:hypothetical protein